MNKVSKEVLRDRQGWPARQESVPVEWQCTQGIAAHVEQVVGSVARNQPPSKTVCHLPVSSESTAIRD
jgi:hypothetical protein